jgi:hypothetical protein
MRMPVREPGNLVTSRLVAGGVGLPRGNITPPGRHSLEAAMRPKVRFPAADGSDCKREGALAPSSGRAVLDAPVTRAHGLAARALLAWDRCRLRWSGHSLPRPGPLGW